MIQVEVPTADDILKRAAELIASPLPHDWADCDFDLGPYCPRCAAASATSELGRELPVGWTDGALQYACMCIAAYNPAGSPPLSESEALAVLVEALAFATE